ncbi:hypothetical protein EYF80_044377 [Liparis tanakae]|uniref:Uncharacterized protein n=1 Tax=Liparis tanakae TaxID=230148 RepID=A0A4Z2FWW8_9TELE|nr:hypothetical protein EYF80_044377 [Liparis tanakae]
MVLVGGLEEIHRENRLTIMLAKSVSSRSAPPSSRPAALAPWQWAPAGRFSSMAPPATPPFLEGKSGYCSLDSGKELQGRREDFKIKRPKHIREPNATMLVQVT